MEFPREARLGFQLAFYRAFAVPKMARVLADTGHFKRDTMRRAYDTGIVIHEIIYGGLDSERGRKMIRLMNALHDRPTSNNPNSATYSTPSSSSPPATSPGPGDAR